jgi:hypothetical protein
MTAKMTQREILHYIHTVTELSGKWKDLPRNYMEYYMEAIYINPDLLGRRHFFEQNEHGMPTVPIATWIDGTKLFCTVTLTNTFFPQDWEDTSKPEGFEGTTWPPTCLAHLTGSPQLEEMCIGCGEAGPECDCDRDSWTTYFRQVWLRHLLLRRVQDRGIGVFVQDPLLKGCKVAELTGKIEPKKETDSEAENNYLCSIAIGSIASNTTTAWINTTYSSSVARFINHSCSPNCQFIEGRCGKNYRLVYVITLRNIDIGEELTLDYGSEWFVGPNEHCLCGESNCRNPPKVTDEDAEMLDMDADIAQTEHREPNWRGFTEYLLEQEIVNE